MDRLLFIFFIYAFLGWCTEVSYAALVSGRFVNRGFLNGPVCPIYGLGVILVLALLEPLKGNKLLLFFASMLITSLLELITGFVLEKIFHQHWWDYSNEPFNLGGYICLRFSIAWGLACTFVVYLVHPTVQLFIRLIPHTLGIIILCLLCALLCLDLIATVRTITRMNRQLSQIDELAGKIKDLSNELGENLADKVLDAAEKRSELKEEWNDRATLLREDLKADLETFKDSLAFKQDVLQEELGEWKADLLSRARQQREELANLRSRLNETMDGRIFGQDRLLKAFPRMRSLKHHKALEKLRQHRSKR